MKHTLNNILGLLFLIIGIILLFSVSAVADMDSTMTFGNALCRLIGAATVAFIGVEFLNMRERGTNK